MWPTWVNEANVGGGQFWEHLPTIIWQKYCKFEIFHPCFIFSLISNRMLFTDIRLICSCWVTKVWCLWTVDKTFSYIEQIYLINIIVMYSNRICHWNSPNLISVTLWPILHWFTLCCLSGNEIHKPILMLCLVFSTSLYIARNG